MTFNWTIKLFAGLPERLGRAEIHIQSPDEQMTAAQLKQLIADAYPEHAALIHISFVACNHAYASSDELLLASNELALLPPVSGGESAEAKQTKPVSALGERFTLTPNVLIPDDILAQVIVARHGASIVFVGTTREWTHGKRTIKLEYEAYEPMAVATMKQIGVEIEKRWPGALCAISHRIGTVDLAEASVVIAVSAPHREACYEASRYAIERLKQIVPIWKKEIWEDGSEWQGHQQGPWNPIAPIFE